jgi:hypothetical protein
MARPESIKSLLRVGVPVLIERASSRKPISAGWDTTN